MYDTSILNTGSGDKFREHFRKLDVKDAIEYFELCISYGLTPTLDKDRKRLKQERRDILNGKLIPTKRSVKIKTTRFDDYIFKLKEGVDYKKELRDFLVFLDKKTKLVKTRLDTEKMIHIFEYFVICSEYKINDWSSWKPTSYNKDKQFSSLVRHMFCKYTVPLFMDSAWIKNDHSQYIQWFIDIGQGKNIRKEQNLPFPLTKKMAHHFLQAPNTYTVVEALYWGLVHGLKGNERNADGILGTKIITGIKEKEDVFKFKCSLIQFFIDNSMLDTSHYGPIVDYIWALKYETHREFIERGVTANMPPEQPNFSMNGRTADVLLKQVEKWHVKLGKETKGGDLQWEHNKFIKDYEIQYGNPQKKTVRFYKITELLSSRELAHEGRKLSHCVGSYSQSCFRGNSSIWSMTFEEHTGIKNLVTIELKNYKNITQVRGLRNRVPNGQERDIIKKWATKEKLGISKYLNF